MPLTFLLRSLDKYVSEIFFIVSVPRLELILFLNPKINNVDQVNLFNFVSIS